MAEIGLRSSIIIDCLCTGAVIGGRCAMGEAGERGTVERNRRIPLRKVLWIGAALFGGILLWRLFVVFPGRLMAFRLPSSHKAPAALGSSVLRFICVRPKKYWESSPQLYLMVGHSWGNNVAVCFPCRPVRYISPGGCGTTSGSRDRSRAPGALSSSKVRRTLLFGWNG